MRSKHPVSFSEVLPRLALWRTEAVEQLRNPETQVAALALKRQIDSAIACLEMCECFGIRPSASVTVLPDLQSMTPSCSYRIVEDGESDDKQHWMELDLEGRRLSLVPGDVIIEQ